MTDYPPTFKQLEMLGRQDNASVAQLFLKENLYIVKTSPVYRNLTINQDSYYLKRFISLLRVRQSVIRCNAQLNNNPVNNLIGSGKGYNNPRALAEFIRRQIGYKIAEIQAQPALQYLRNLLEEIHFFVFKNTVLKNEKIDSQAINSLVVL